MCPWRSVSVGVSAVAVRCCGRGAPERAGGWAVSEWVAVTDLRQRPDPAVAVRPSIVLHGCLVAVAAALSGLAVLAAVVLVAWVADAGPGSGGGSAVRAAADAWLLAHGGGLSLPTGHVRGIPLGLTLLAAIVLHRAGASLARAVTVTDLRGAGRATAALAVPYGLLAATVAKVAAVEGAASSALAAGAGALLLAGLAGGQGVLRAADLAPALRRRLPDGLPAVVRAAAVGVAGLAAAGLVLVTVALVRHAGRFADLVGAVDPGFVGGVVLVLGCVLLLPNAALWAVAYAAGPGFGVGAGTGVSPFGATLGPVPSFPLLAALPGDGTPPTAVRAVLLLPVLVGVLIGWHLARHRPAAGPRAAAAGRSGADRSGGGSTRAAIGAADPTGWLRAVRSGRAVRSAGLGLAAGAVAALLTAVLAALAGGSLGPGYLAAVGPSAWRVAVALAVELAVPAALTAALLPTRADPSAPTPRPATRPRPPATRPPATRPPATRPPSTRPKPADTARPAPVPSRQAAAETASEPAHPAADGTADAADEATTPAATTPATTSPEESGTSEDQ